MKRITIAFVFFALCNLYGAELEVGEEAAMAGTKVAEEAGTSAAEVGAETAVKLSLKESIRLAWKSAYSNIKTAITDYLAKRAVLKTATKAAQDAGKQFVKDFGAKTGKLSSEELEKTLQDNMEKAIRKSLGEKNLPMTEQMSKQVTNLITSQSKKVLLSMTLPAKLLGNFVSQLAIPMLLYSSVGVAESFEDQADADTFQQLSQEQKQLENGFNNFINDYNQQQLNRNQQIISSFIASQQLISQQYGASAQQLQLALLYLAKSVSMSVPKQLFLVDYITLDQLFEHSLMLTPKANNKWYNLFQIGDWEFNENTNTFMQQSLVNFYSQEAPDNPEYSQNNSIFTEYATGNNKYDIQIECTIHRVTYPFFVGIIFNRARWISGDPERLRQFRLLGFYGASNTISLHYAENVTQGSGDNMQMLSPMKQIISPDNRTLQSLDASITKQLSQNNSVTYVFSITTQPTQISYKVWKKGDQPSSAMVINNLNPLLFLYGGIGFMAAGARAEFKIVQPAPLQFSKKQIDDFKKDLSASLLKMGGNS